MMIKLSRLAGAVALSGCLVSAAPLYFPPTTGPTWDTISPTSLGWQTNRIDSLDAYLVANNTRAFIVLKGGKIAVEHYFGTFTKDSLWYWASAGKTLTSCMVGIAQQEGLLSIQDKTSKWLGAGWTSCPADKEDLITVRHQLTMTSGLDDASAGADCTVDTCLKYLADAGARWAYHNAPYTLLDKVVEAATGQTFNAYVAAKVRNRIGMNGAFIRSGYNNVYFSSPRSMARFGLLILNRGVWDGTAIITDTAYFRQMTTPSQDINKSYGYLWWLNGKASFMVPQSQLVIPGSMAPNAPADMFAALGKNGQFINVVPSMDLVFIRMGDAPANDMVPFTMNNEIWKRLNAVMSTGSAVISHSAHSASTVVACAPVRLFDIRGRQIRLSAGLRKLAAGVRISAGEGSGVARVVE